MQRYFWPVLLLLLSSVPAQAAVVGREAPGCAEAVLSDVTGAVGIDAGTCLVVDLDTLEPGTVFEVDVLVIDDAIDLLVFDAAARTPYDLGQGYRAGMTLPASTESLLGELGFHWRVPASIQPKAWSLVLDNLAHDGDQGMGDQGGARSTVNLLVNPIDEGALTVVHDLYGVEENASSWLTPQGGLSLDAGTSLLLEAWPVDGAGDLLLLNDDERAAWEGGASMSPPAGRSMLDVDGDATLSWVLPASLEGTPMHLLFDATNRTDGGAAGEDVRATVRLTLDPPLAPVVTDSANGSTTLGVGLTLDAGATPDRLMRLEAWSWDLDGGVDAEGTALTGNAWGDEASTTSTWSTPGTKTVTLQVRDVDGRTASTTHLIEVSDVVAPVAAVASLGAEQPIADGYRIGIDDVLRLSCAPSSDDHRIETCSWSIDGSAAAQNTTLVSSWSSPGEHTVRLTVTDPSGGADVLERRVVVTDASPPSITAGSVATLPATVEAGAQVVVSVVVEDDVDPTDDLVVHWDLAPLVDTDGNGVKDDDADAEGPQVALSFSEVGEQTVVITVEDPSGNRDRVVWSVEVTAPSNDQRGGAWLGFLVVLLLAGGGATVVLLRRRSGDEPQPAIEPEPTAEERAEAAKAAEMASIYGASATSAAPRDPYAAPMTFAAAPPAGARAAMDDASRALFDGGAATSATNTGEDALASLMNADEQPTETSDASQPQPRDPVEEATSGMAEAPAASSEGVAAGGRLSLPAGFASMLNTASLGTQTPAKAVPEPAPQHQEEVQATCPSCDQRFIARLPDNLQAARAACPSCASHVTVRHPPVP